MKYNNPEKSDQPQSAKSRKCAQGCTCGRHKPRAKKAHAESPKTGKKQSSKRADFDVLGIVADFRTPTTETPVNTGPLKNPKSESLSDVVRAARRTRYKLQTIAQSVLKGFYLGEIPKTRGGFDKMHRTCTCTMHRIKSDVDVIKSSNNKAFYSGLKSCANSRTCPLCAAVINERKANEMRLAANQREALGLHMSLLTFTAPHTVGDEVGDLVVKISEALSGFWRGAPAKRFKERFGIVGHVRSFEVRYGVHGWHPHFHIIIFSKHKLPTTKINFADGVRTVAPVPEQDTKWQWMLERWQTMCQKAGLAMPNAYGMDIQSGDKAGEYITKFGSDGEILETKAGQKITWDMCDELTKGNVKKGLKGSWSPWDLLDRAGDADLSDDERKQARLLFLAYARAMVGVTQIKWSRGLRSVFGLSEKELTDEEILKKEEDKASWLCRISAKEWRVIVKAGLRATVLDLAEAGGADAVANLIFALMPLTQSLDDFKAAFVARNPQINEGDALSKQRAIMGRLAVDGHHARIVHNYFMESVVVENAFTLKPMQKIDFSKYYMLGTGAGRYLMLDDYDPLKRVQKN